MRRYVLSHAPIALLYASLVYLLRGVWQGFAFPTILNWVWWVVGTLIGVLILYLDRVVYTYSYPAEQLSQQFSWYWKQRQYGTALSLLDTRRLEQEKLTFRSAIFMVVWVPLAFFALTSTSALFGKGVVMGLMLHILADAWRLQRTDPQRLHTRLFWQIKREISMGEQTAFLSIMSALFVLFSFWVG